MKPTATTTPDLTRAVLLILVIATLIAGSLWTMLAFLSALLWASALVISTWPLMTRLERLAGGSRAIATTSMTLLVAAVFLVPFGLAATALLGAAVDSVALVQGVASNGFPPPPGWVENIPWLGARLAARWQEFAAGGSAALESLRPYLRSIAAWAVSVTGGFGGLAVHFLLIVIIVGILYKNGESAARGVVALARRIGGQRGESSMRLAAQAVRGVALGIIVTAVVESIIGGVGLLLAGVPRAALLVAVMIVLSVAQLGPLPVLLPTIVWLFWTVHVTQGVVLAVFTVVVVICDNVLKPVLIRRGVDLPLLLIIPGVIGGLVSFGVMGLFIGPVILAVAYTLLVAWVRDDPSCDPLRKGADAP